LLPVLANKDVHNAAVFS